MFPRSAFLYKYAIVLFVLCIFIYSLLLQQSSRTVSKKRLPWEVQEEFEIAIERTTLLRSINNITRSIFATTTSQPPVVNPHNFTYILNPVNMCTGSDVYFILYIHTSPSNFRRRQIIRHTWGDPRLLRKNKAKLVFVLGQVSNDKVMKKVKMEYHHYRDIVQENFYDSYKNLTYKGIAGLKWITNFCKHATFAIKSDDDIMINLFKILDEVKNKLIIKSGVKNHILCNKWNRMKVLRDEKSKWYVPKKDFEPDFYPPYCSGSAFILSMDVVEKMYKASFYTKFFWVDDYYITGALAMAANVTQTQWSHLYMLNAKIVADILKNNTKSKYAFFHMSKINSIHRMWNNLVKRIQNEEAMNKNHTADKTS